jgi:hypothetical protein
MLILQFLKLLLIVSKKFLNKKHSFLNLSPLALTKQDRMRKAIKLQLNMEKIEISDLLGKIQIL